MKTAIRTTVNKSENKDFNLMYIQILVPRYGGHRYLEVTGTITFQQTVGEDSWYGMNFEIRTSEIKKLEKFTKLARFISKNTDYNVQPDELKKLIGADEHVFFEHDFIPVSKNGENLYKVIVREGHYTSLVAKDEKAAQKELKKLNIANSTLEFDKEIVL